VPVINGLTNEYHPCQILADVFTCIEQRGSMAGKIVAWVGDGNNMATTWLQAADILDFTLHVSTPNGYEIDPMAVGLRRDDCLKVFKHPLDACRNADVVTTDVWTSMGYEAENAERKVAFADWCVDAEMMAAARPTPSSCTACRPTAARRSMPRSSTGRSRSSGTRPRTGCTCRRR
jgi:ornithine carbamoyltransferase